MDIIYLMPKKEGKVYEEAEIVKNGLPVTLQWVSERHNSNELPRDKIMCLVSVGVEVPDGVVDDIITTALEGGINYWCERVDVLNKDYKGKIIASEIVSAGGTLIIVTDEEAGNEQFKLDRITFQRGLKKWLEEGLKVGNRFSNDDLSSMDAAEADAVIQYSIFGEIVYG